MAHKSELTYTSKKVFFDHNGERCKTWLIIRHYSEYSTQIGATFTRREAREVVRRDRAYHHKRWPWHFPAA